MSQPLINLFRSLRQYACGTLPSLGVDRHANVQRFSHNFFRQQELACTDLHFGILTGCILLIYIFK